MMILFHLRGLCFLIIFPLLGLCCQTRLSNIYSRISRNAEFQFNITPPSGVERYNIINKDTKTILRVDYTSGPSSGTHQSVTGVTFTGDVTIGNLSFTLEDVQQDDGGTYKLDLGAITLQCQTLFILGKPTRPTLGYNNDHTVVGETVNLTCASVSTTVPHDHGLTLRYSWTVDGATNPTDSRYTYSTSGDKFSIYDVTKEDRGKLIRCMATEAVMGGLMSDTSGTSSFNVTYGPDTVTLNPSSVSYTENEATQLSNIHCSADCNPLCKYRWTKQGQTNVVSATGTLNLGLIQRSDAGIYTCTVTNPYKTMTAHVMINVRYSPDVSAYLSSNNLAEHNSLQLSCNATGVPDTYNYTALTQTWRGTAIPHIRPPISNTPLHSSLQFTDLQLQDTGIYTCHVNNGVMNMDGQLEQTASVLIQVKVSPHVLLKTLSFPSEIHTPISITIPFYSYPQIVNISLHKTDNTQITNDTTHFLSHKAEEVTSQFYGKDIILNGNIFQFYINNLSEEDFSVYKLRLHNDMGLSETIISIIHESIPDEPTLFRFMGVIGSVPQFYWEKRFNGGHKQYFVLETTLFDSDKWTEELRIEKDNQQYHFKPMQSYIANISGLPPGQYRARLTAGNKIGQTTYSADIVTTFSIPHQVADCENAIQGEENVNVIVGGVGGAVVVAIAVAAVVLFLQRGRPNVESSCGPCSSLCQQGGRHEPRQTRQGDDTFKNEVFEDDPVQTGVVDTTFGNETRSTYESLQRQMSNPDAYESIATGSNIQIREMYEILGEGREQNMNYESLNTSADNLTQISKEYVNL